MCKKCKTIRCAKRCAKTVYWDLINSNMNKRDVHGAVNAHSICVCMWMYSDVTPFVIVKIFTSNCNWSTHFSL